ncbi:MAG TPA: hypothetical protein VGN76_08805 [Gemmatimonadales bacterium]|nr:hypothetical protein [Gemmatimonadales bacterium]
MARLRSAGLTLSLFLAGSAVQAQTHMHNGTDSEKTEFRGFADVTFLQSAQPDRHSSFGLGQYVFFITSPLAEHISFLGETTFQYNTSFQATIERVAVTFSPTNYFRVSMGRMHTPIGYWNNTYHHGTLIQPTIDRPVMFLFENRRGVLPIHTTGIQVGGRDVSALHLGYDIMIGNGIGSSPTTDNDQAKSYTVSLHSQVTSALRIGASFYGDHIAAGTLNLAGTAMAQGVGQRMVGGFAVLQGSQYELLAEYQHSRNHPDLSGGPTVTHAMYAYGGYRFGDLVPYLRYDQLQFPAGDLYYTDDDVRLGIVGARYDFSPQATGKLELRRRTTTTAGTFTEVAAQIAVGF